MKTTDEPTKNYDNLYNQLNLIINQQGILSQKVGILLAINTLFISFIITFAYSLNNWWFLFLFSPSIIALILNVYILFPNFSNSNKDQTNNKYWFQFKDIDLQEIKAITNNEENILNQIQVNSGILTKKYKYFSHSLAITFFGLPYLFILLQKIQKKNKKSNPN